MTVGIYASYVTDTFAEVKKGSSFNGAAFFVAMPVIGSGGEVTDKRAEGSLPVFRAKGAKDALPVGHGLTVFTMVRYNRYSYSLYLGGNKDDKLCKRDLKRGRGKSHNR